MDVARGVNPQGIFREGVFSCIVLYIVDEFYFLRFCKRAFATHVMSARRSTSHVRLARLSTFKSECLTRIKTEIQHDIRVFQSDVWSFGVLLWELFTFGEYPYSHVRDNDDLYDRLCKGQQLRKPNCTPMEMLVFEACRVLVSK
uniref:Protein kinase domain-containing protein n=1 Tax=Parascaris equorum TaxID=6256 RepID=A0A914R865_PAREQ